VGKPEPRKERFLPTIPSAHFTTGGFPDVPHLHRRGPRVLCFVPTFGRAWRCLWLCWAGPPMSRSAARSVRRGQEAGRAVYWPYGLLQTQGQLGGEQQEARGRV